MNELDGMYERNSYLLNLIGTLLVKNYNDLPDDVDLDAWRVGYSNAISDLIKTEWPDKPGARRITLDELKTEDLRRAMEKTRSSMNEVKKVFGNSPRSYRLDCRECNYKVWEETPELARQDMAIHLTTYDPRHAGGTA